VEAVAGFVLTEKKLAGLEVLAHGSRSERSKFCAREAGEQRCLFEDGYEISGGRRHGEKFNAR
jgi:hypothetical protein